MSFESPLVTRLKRSEGWRDKVYLDTTGNLTIAYGYNLGKLYLPEGVKLSQVRLEPVNGITIEMGEELLYQAVAEAMHHVDRLPFTLDPVRRDVLVELVFEIGPKVLKYPVFMDQLERKAYLAAAQNMRGWDWYKTVHETRAEPLCRMMATGVQE